MDIRYVPIVNDDRKQFKELVHQLYGEDTGGQPMTDQKIETTIEFLNDNPKGGEILVFKDGSLIVGYAVLIFYWSNEYGGQIMLVDELYIDVKYRGKQIGTDFLQYLVRRKNDFKAITLEVIPSNERALSFYIRNGFTLNKRHFLKYTL